MAIQKEATIMVGTADPPDQDVSEWFHTFIPRRTREQIVDDPTYAKAERSTILGASEGVVEARFKGDHDVASFWAMADDAFDTDDGVLFFSVLYHPGEAVGPSNPLWTGEILIATSDGGGAAGQKWELTATFPARNIAKSVTPGP